MLTRRGQISGWVRTALLEALLLGGAGGTVRAASPMAAGQITDLQGRAVAGVLIQAESWESQALGTGRSDAKGRFQIALSEPVKDLTLIIEHPGFQRWALAGTSTGKGDFQIRLTRNIDREYLTELAAQSEPEHFRQLAMDLLAPSLGTTGNSSRQLEQVLPFLKALRQRLRALLPAEPAQLKSRHLKKEEDEAALLLAYLGDPRDDALIDAWAVRQSFISRPPRPCRGPTPDAAARAWQKLHFEKESSRTPPAIPYNFLQTQIAPSGDHGLALHSVRYAYWGYSQYLVLVRLNNAWEVRRIIDGEHWHRG
ncbi:MAG TPA: carboxypeptidase-like regulatory domain-containing protein [Thermoanaerobaculia bacterium]|nr:carboxypeptidase-like regulatory domain-containing protein [Thermoanaerobaculia bacterium]